MWRVLLMPWVVIATFACAVPSGTVADMHTDRPLRLWQDAAIFESVTGVIAGARSRVWVEMYEFGRSDLARQLAARSRSGIDVRLIVDPSVAVSRRVASFLLGLGVAVRYYPIDDARHQIDHVKLLLTDSEAVVGGMNWGGHSDRNHDFAFELRRGEALRRLGEIFTQDWGLASGHLAPLMPLTGPNQASVVETAPGQEVRDQLNFDIANARRLIHAEIFVLTDSQVIAELAQAQSRGVEVKLLMDPNQDVNLPGFALLRSAGVNVRWYPVPSGAKLHAKAGLFDDQLLLGSANWSLSGLSVNHELDVQTADPVAVASFSGRFDSDWAAAGPGFCCG